MTTTDPAIQAAAEALALIPGTTVAYPLSVAATVVAAARPHIEAEVRAQVAAAIRAVDPVEWALAGMDAGEDAARIAEGGA